MADDELTYTDVHMILAAADAWPRGTFALRCGSLNVRLIRSTGTALPDYGAPKLAEVKAPTVGRWTAIVRSDARLASGTQLGIIHAPGRDTSVFCETAGRLVRYEASDQSFVEYGHVVAVVQPEADR